MLTIQNDSGFAKIDDVLLSSYSEIEGRMVLVQYEPQDVTEFLALVGAVRRYVRDEKPRTNTQIRFEHGVTLGTVRGTTFELAETTDTRVSVPADLTAKHEQTLVSLSLMESTDVFAQGLGKALGSAGPEHAERLRAAFPDIWTEHLDRGKRNGAIVAEANRRVPGNPGNRP